MELDRYRDGECQFEPDVSLRITCAKIRLSVCRNRNHALDDEITRLKRSLAEWEKRFRDKEQEFFGYKEKQRSAPEVKLQADINMLTLEKVTRTTSHLIRLVRVGV